MSLLKTAILPLILGSLLLGDGWLGVYLADAEDEARIAEVIPGSPAEKCDLRPGDVVLEVEGRPTGSVEAFVEAIGRHDAGASIRLKLRRGGEELTVRAVLGARPADRSPLPSAPPGQVPPGRAFLGVRVHAGEGGISVLQVFPDSPASGAGIAVGDRIARVGGEALGSLEDLERVMNGLAPGDQISVNLQNERGSSSLLIRLGDRSRASAPGAVPGGAGGDSTPSPSQEELENRLERAELEVRRMSDELRVLLELRGELQQLQELRVELAELSALIRQLRRDR